MPINLQAPTPYSGPTRIAPPGTFMYLGGDVMKDEGPIDPAITQEAQRLTAGATQLDPATGLVSTWKPQYGISPFSVAQMTAQPFSTLSRFQPLAGGGGGWAMPGEVSPFAMRGISPFGTGFQQQFAGGPHDILGWLNQIISPGGRGRRR